MASPGLGHASGGVDQDDVPAAVGAAGFALYEQALAVLGDSKQREEVRLKAAQDLNEGLDAAIALSSSQDLKKTGGFLHQVDN